MIRYLGVDWGQKRIGLAMAESENSMAIPFKNISNISELFEIIDQEDINEVIIGEPNKMVGGLDNKEFSRFVDIFRKRSSALNLKINFVDERLSSKQADALKDKGAKQDRDSVSAMIILQSFLDKKYAKN